MKRMIRQMAAGLVAAVFMGVSVVTAGMESYAFPMSQTAEELVQADIYQQIYASVRNGEAYFYSDNIDTWKLMEYIRMIDKDPVLFNYAGYSYEVRGTAVTVTWVYFMPQEQYEAELAAADAAANKLAASVLEWASDDTRVRFVHDWLCYNVAYESSSNDQNMYGALVERKCVCNGYSDAFQYVLSKLGVYTDIMWGVNMYGENHAWNCAWIDGEIYYFDVTGDKTSDGVRYNWYKKTADELLKYYRPNDASLCDIVRYTKRQ